MVRSRISSLLLQSLAGGIFVLVAFRLLVHLDQRGAGRAAGWDRIGEAQLFVLIALVSIVLLLVAVIGALEGERARAAGAGDEAEGASPPSAKPH